MNFKRTHIPVLTITAAALFAAWPSGLAKRTLLTNAVVHTVSGPTHTPGFVLLDGDTIKAVGPAEKMPQFKKVDTINLKGQHIFPGIIATTTALGLMEIAAVRATVDTSEVGTYTPEVKSWLAINPDSELLPVARAGDITTVLIRPTGGVIAGQASLATLAG
ncbi:MAG: amidohydrolase, partial [Limisphaerales bacterium]